MPIRNAPLISKTIGRYVMRESLGSGSLVSLDSADFNRATPA